MLTVIKHFFSVHSVEPNFFFICGINGCLHAFKCGSSFSSFKTHASRTHHGWQDDLLRSHLSCPSLHTLFSGPAPAEQATLHQSTTVSTDETHDEMQFGSPMTPELSPGSAHTVLPVSGESTTLQAVNPDKVAALFLLTLQEKYKVSQAAINFTVGSIHSILEGVSKPHSLNFNDPFASLKTEHQQMKFYRREFGLVVRKIDVAT